MIAKDSVSRHRAESVSQWEVVVFSAAQTAFMNALSLLMTGQPPVMAPYLASC